MELGNELIKDKRITPEMEGKKGGTRVGKTEDKMGEKGRRSWVKDRKMSIYGFLSEILYKMDQGLSCLLLCYLRGVEKEEGHRTLG